MQIPQHRFDFTGVLYDASGDRIVQAGNLSRGKVWSWGEQVGTLPMQKLSFFENY